MAPRLGSSERSRRIDDVRIREMAMDADIRDVAGRDKTVGRTSPCCP